MRAPKYDLNSNIMDVYSLMTPRERVQFKSLLIDLNQLQEHCCEINKTNNDVKENKTKTLSNIPSRRVLVRR